LDILLVYRYQTSINSELYIAIVGCRIDEQDSLFWMEQIEEEREIPGSKNPQLGISSLFEKLIQRPAPVSREDRGVPG
jgi:hypothetical protein